MDLILKRILLVPGGLICLVGFIGIPLAMLWQGIAGIAHGAVHTLRAPSGVLLSRAAAPGAYWQNEAMWLLGGLVALAIGAALALCLFLALIPVLFPKAFADSSTRPKNAG